MYKVIITLMTVFLLISTYRYLPQFKFIVAKPWGNSSSSIPCKYIQYQGITIKTQVIMYLTYCKKFKVFQNHKNVPTQFRQDLRQEFLTRPFCCHLVRGRLQLLFKALLNDQEHLFCLANFAQVNTLLHAAVILVGSLSTPHAK